MPKIYCSGCGFDVHDSRFKKLGKTAGGRLICDYCLEIISSKKLQAEEREIKRAIANDTTTKSSLAVEKIASAKRAVTRKKVDDLAFEKRIKDDLEEFVGL